jgi:NADH:flavin oxidoreductase / NADH oxidase family
VQLYASTAGDGARFDDVDIHAANVYLPDQLLTNPNEWTYLYGGSMENRALCASGDGRIPRLCLHPCFGANHTLQTRRGKQREIRTQTSYCETWSDGAYIANSDFGHDSAIEAVEKKGPGLVLFAHHFISNVGR